MDLADIDRQRIDAGLLDEVARRADIGETQVIRAGLPEIAGDTGKSVHLGLDRDAGGMRLDDKVCDGVARRRRPRCCTSRH